MKRKIALITGITGQDGSYLTELLLNKGYEVHGLVRRVAFENENERFSRIGHILDKIKIHLGDVADYPTVWRLIAKVQPDEVYHLAAQSFVKASFEDDFNTFRINADGTHYILSAIKELSPRCKFYFAATSEMFGNVKTSPQNENTRFSPVSPYGISKLAGYYFTKMHREAYGLFACSGILFNHESPRRGLEFVTRKITNTAAKIKLGLAKELRLGNLDAKRDWGYAGDYVKVMWLMLQQKQPDDYVIATGKSYSVKDFVKEVFGCLKLDWKKYVKIDKSFLRPTDVFTLRGDSSKARRILKWSPRVDFRKLARMMVGADLEYERSRIRE